MITIIENLTVPKLKILNLSGNQIWKLDGLSHLQELQSLSINHNYLNNYESIEHLKECSPTLTNVDLRYNKIEGDEAMIGLFINIKCLNLTENPCVREQKYYRRSMVGHLPNLIYLDSRAIDT
jgi:Leucine-rich repeat (LRR) protein